MRHLFDRYHSTHLSEGLLKRLGPEVREELEPLLRHLAQFCSICRECYLACGGQLDASSYEESYRRAVERVPELEKLVEEDRITVKENLQRLLRFQPQDRVGKIERANSRYSSPLLVDALLDEARKVLLSDPEKAHNLAECAEAVAFRIAHIRFGGAAAHTALARARGHRGNSLRVLGNFLEADRLLNDALSMLWNDGTGDPLVTAEVLLLLVSLRKDQHRYDEAELLAEEAIMLYFESGQDSALIPAVLNKSYLLTSKGDLDRAIETSHEVLALLDLYPDEKLRLMATHNLAYQLELAGRLEEALTLLVKSKPLYRRFPEPWAQFRYAWSQGRILRELGQIKAAEGHLKGARAGFASSGSAFDLALVSLDLALLYLQTGSLAEIGDLCAEALPIFKANMLNREAMAAWLLFGEAVKQEALNAELIQEVMQRIEKARNLRESRPN